MLTATSTMSSDNYDATFDEELQIDMKGPVGDAVGNMSISPTSRDIVLAARRGLFIIDLDAPLEVPRFLPQGGTWDVADVQWNPHPSHANYIISTSSEKLLIWNLMLGGKTAIEHILQSHWRAITDINWHNTDPNLVVSTAIDGWLWAWDIRTPQKPILGLCAFNAGGTQVKWNRQDENILASSHMNEILIWDRRKGSLPLSRIQAHSAKIYGIDWSHDRKNEIVTCSLDRTIKVFDVQTSSHDDSSLIHEPKITFQTSYPVWRARDLPFGRGVLSLPQRGETALEMFAHDHPQSSAKTFEGHTDVVKEFVWRRGGQDLNNFQLITWSKDKTLRFWPITNELVNKMGPKSIPINTLSQSRLSDGSTKSFRSGPQASYRTPYLSAPVGHILAEVRAPQPFRGPQPLFPPNKGEHGRDKSPNKSRSFSQVRRTSAPVSITNTKGGTMTRGHNGGMYSRMDTLTWLNSVKVGERREGSSETGSGVESGNVSRKGSKSRRNSKSDYHERTGLLRRSESRARGEDEAKENDLGQPSLQDEITSVMTKLSSYKIKLEKHDLTKKRTIEVGLHGPWGETSSVFFRAKFIFPKDYPQAPHPLGTPTVELDRNPLISLKDRAFMLGRLRAIRQTQRPCLEQCLRFLLLGDQRERIRRNSDSSSDEDASRVRVAALQPWDEELPYAVLRNDKNLAEPRTSQGVFGPNGELVCFSRAPPRIVRNPLHDMSVSPSMRSHHGSESMPSLFRSPALLSDAISQLNRAANDRATTYSPRRPEDNTNILRIMTNLLTFSERKQRRSSEHTKPVDDMSYSLLPTRRSTVLIKDASSILSLDRQVASEYILDISIPRETCQKNASLARKRGRFDHERVFKLLKIFVESQEVHESPVINRRGMRIAGNVCTKLYEELCGTKDIQMLAMLSIVLLRYDPATNIAPVPLTPGSPRGSHTLASDYFSRPGRRKESRKPSVSPGWYRAQPSPTSRAATILSSPPSSRGSWSSLFNTGSMRNFMASMQESQETSDPSQTEVPGQIPVPKGEDTHRDLHRVSSDSPLKRSIAKSWSDPSTSAPTKPIARPSSRRPTFSQAVITNDVSEHHCGKTLVAVTSVSAYESPVIQAGMDLPLRTQLLAHIEAYGEVLLRWQLLRQRAELVNSIKSRPMASSEEYRLGVLRTCSSCGSGIASTEVCSLCKVRVTLPRCSVCRLPVKGLSRSCLYCGHLTHIRCWKSTGAGCATGCGCDCMVDVSH